MISDYTATLLNASHPEYKQQFLATVKTALRNCSYDGIEFDYEGPPTPAEADRFTDFLVELKAVLGPGSVVSADIAVWTDFPYVNPKRTGFKSLDFVNVMTYFFDDAGKIDQYQEAAATLTSWGYPLSTVNLGVPFYDSKQSDWGSAAASCPDVAPATNNCSGATFVGKSMNLLLGQYAQRAGFAGVFPWQANYDTVHNNNGLAAWLAEGLLGPCPPAPPPPPPDPQMPHYLAGYVYTNRDAAAKACTHAGFKQLCAKAELQNHPRCSAGWCSDFEGYWMGQASAGCGSAGYNTWSGPAGAYCCNA